MHEDNSTVGIADQTVEHALDRLPSGYQMQLQKSYEMPNSKIGVTTVFRYGTPLEYAMQTIGLMAAIGAGTFP